MSLRVVGPDEGKGEGATCKSVLYFATEVTNFSLTIEHVLHWLHCIWDYKWGGGV